MNARLRATEGVAWTASPPEHNLLNPDHLTSRAEALARPAPVPAQPGVYAWYFDVPPSGVPHDGTHRNAFGYLLYLGIAPREPRRSDGQPSSQNLRKRIRTHFRGDASRSTLRLTLGLLLSEELGIQLRRNGSGRLTFGEGEAAVSDWMAEHSRVCWYVHRQPWRVESELISELVLPLNLDQNRHGSFHETLSGGLGLGADVEEGLRDHGLRGRLVLADLVERRSQLGARLRAQQ
ncbi:GIY-YIG nuclease family protein [Ornithinimicrobium murale]|uniref:GIY-YIG nuclease family protein n=1 Tax=Ornithinimicrobium murale TaxID=1050153 RepID=UPI003B51251F